MSTCRAWMPTDSGNRHCGEPATRQMQTWDGVVPRCDHHYEEARGRP